MSIGSDKLEKLFITGGGVLGPRQREAALVGERIGVYEIVDIIGRGGMATVYLGERRDDTFEQRVAVKVLEVQSIGERFARERRILARLDHPGIARIFDGGALPDGRPYLIMEYVSGDPVTFAADNAPSLDRRLDWFEQICEAVSAAHNEGIVHRDLKPDNVLVDRHGHVKLLDFGIAGWGVDADSESLNLMTPRFAAPEQFRGEAVSFATDVFQLGLLLYLLVTGRQAAGETDDPDELRRRVEHLPLEIPSRVKRDPGDYTVDRELDLIVDRCLQPDPADRYPEVATLLKDFRAWRQGRATTLTAGQFAPAAKRLWRRHPRALVAAVFATVLLVAAGYLGWTQIQKAETRSQAMSELASNISEGATDRISSSSFELSGGAIADNPDLERELAFLTAQALLNAQRPADAISMLEAILARARGSFEAPDRLADLLYLLGEAHRREGNMTLALRHLSAAESELRGTQSPLWQKSVTSLAAAHLRNDNLAQAADLMADAAIVEPDLLAAARHLRSLDESNCSSDGDGLVEPLRTEIAAWCAAHAAQ